MNSNYEILKTLNNVPRFAFWRIDDVLIVFIPFMLGILTSSLVILFSGFVLKVIVSRVRKRFGSVSIPAFTYWYLGVGFKSFLPSYVRRLRR